MKFLIKVLIFPIVAVTTVIQWAMLFLTNFSSVLLNIISGAVFLIAVLSLILGTAPMNEVAKMLLISFAVFILPRIAELFISNLMCLNMAMRDYLKS